MVSPMDRAAQFLQPGVKSPSRIDLMVLPTRALALPESQSAACAVRVLRGHEGSSPVVGFTVYYNNETAARAVTDRIVTATAGRLERYYGDAKKAFSAIQAAGGHSGEQTRWFSDEAGTRTVLKALRWQSPIEKVNRLLLTGQNGDLAFFVGCSFTQLCAVTHPCMSGWVKGLGRRFPTGFLSGDTRRVDLALRFLEQIEEGKFHTLKDQFTSDEFGCQPDGRFGPRAVGKLLEDIGIHGIDVDEQLHYFQTGEDAATAYRYGVTVLFSDSENQAPSTNAPHARRGHGTYSYEAMFAPREFIAWYVSWAARTAS